LWGASPLYEFEGLKEESIPTLIPIDKILDGGNCGEVTNRGEEACEDVRKRRVCVSPPGLLLVKAARLRTETRYKAGADRGIDLREVMATLRQECEPPALSEGRALTDSVVEPATTDQLMEQIVDPTNLDRAWRQVKRNRGSPGPDGITIQGFESQARAIWRKTCQQLLVGTYRHIVNINLSKFFDRVNHDVLMHCLSRHVGDKRLLKLIRRYLRAGVMVEGVVQPTEKGTPQGGPLSPFLSNVLLDALDKELESRGHRFVRYADDFVIFVKSSRSAERVHHTVGRFLSEKLKLIVNEDKSSHGPAEGCEYLGFQFTGRRATIKVSAKKLKAMGRRVKELTGRSRGISMDRRLTELRRYLRSWIGYFGLARAGGRLCQARCLDSPPHPDVFLEAMAIPTDEDPPANRTWC